jgi:hypothetical protein
VSREEKGGQRYQEQDIETGTGIQGMHVSDRHSVQEGRVRESHMCVIHEVVAPHNPRYLRPNRARDTVHMHQTEYVDGD